MYPIPRHEFMRRLEKWRANPTARLFRHVERGQMHYDYWMEGRTYLRVVRVGKWAELWGDRGVRNFHRPEDHGHIAFTQWDSVKMSGFAPGPPVTVPHAVLRR